MSETTLKLKAQAEVAAIREYIGALRELRSEINATQATMRASPGGDVGGVVAGMPPATTAGQPTPPPAFTPPSASPAPSTIPAAAVSPGNALGALRNISSEASRLTAEFARMRQAVTAVNGALGGGGGAAGAPPPPAASSWASVAASAASVGGGFLGSLLGSWWGAAAPSSPGSAPPTAGGGAGGRGRVPGAGGGGFELPEMDGPMFSPATRHGYHALGRAADRVINIGLGHSAMGFLTASGQKYMELSTIITQLGRRFRETGENADYFGGKMGYTIAQSAGFAETLGGETNRFDRGQFLQGLGFARQFGADPNAVLRMQGRLSRLSSTQLGAGALSAIAAAATTQGMDKGRMAEFMDSLTSLGERQFSATGSVHMGHLLATQALPGQIFGNNDPRAQGQAGAGFIERMNGVMTGSGPMRSFMMRAMGYGGEGGPSYIDMRKRLEAGVFDPQNVVDLFSAFQDRGMGQGAMFRAIEGVAGGQLKAHEISDLVSTLGTAEGLERFRATGERPSFNRMNGDFLASLSDSERATFSKLGFEGLGSMPGRIGMGEGAGVQMEGMMMAVGKPMAEAMLDIRDVVVNIAGSFQNLAGMDFGKLITDISGFMVTATDFMKGVTGSGPLKGATGRGLDFIAHPGDYDVSGGGILGTAAAGYRNLVSGTQMRTFDNRAEYDAQMRAWNPNYEPGTP